MEIKLKLEQDNKNNCIQPIITLDSPYREVRIKTEDLRKVVNII